MPLRSFFCPRAAAALAGNGADGALSEPPRRERRKDARPGELLDAALALFAEKGFAATRVEEVAARAGVSKGTLFLYFPSKETLLKAVVRENIAGRFAEWNAEFDTFAGDSRDMLAYCVRSWWERVGATNASAIVKVMMGEAANFPEIARFYQQEVVEPGHRLVRRILERGIARGEIRSLDLDYAIFGVVAPLMFLALTRHSAGGCMPPGQSLDPERYLRAQLGILLDGVCAPPGSADAAVSPATAAAAHPRAASLSPAPPA